jgi:hypothetical protein
LIEPQGAVFSCRWDTRKIKAMHQLSQACRSADAGNAHNYPQASDAQNLWISSLVTGFQPAPLLVRTGVFEKQSTDQ